MLLEITLKCFSLMKILDLLNQVVNVMWSSYHRIRYPGDVEINIFVINRKVELVRVITMFKSFQLLALLCELPSTGFPIRSWSFRTRFSSSFRNSPVRSEELSSPCDLTTSLGSQTPPVRSSMDLGNWVDLEEAGRSASPSDCWTGFPTGWCSTKQPDWSFPLVPIEIVFQRDLWWWTRRQILSFIQLLSSFSIFQLLQYNGLGCVPWRIIAFVLVW